LSPSNNNDKQNASLFLDWRRSEPNNHTVSEGFRTDGEKCTSLIAWQEDPLIKEQGSWNDVSCELKKPFICQLQQITTRFVLSVNNRTLLYGGSFVGGLLNLKGKNNEIVHFSMNRSSVLEFSNTAKNSSINTLFIEDGSTVYLKHTDVNVYSANAFIGEYSFFKSLNETTVDLKIQPMQPSFIVDKNSTFVVKKNSKLDIFANFEVYGNLYVDSDANLNILQVNSLFL
jgi:hypothetical protein